MIRTGRRERAVAHSRLCRPVAAKERAGVNADEVSRQGRVGQVVFGGLREAAEPILRRQPSWDWVNEVEPF